MPDAMIMRVLLECLVCQGPATASQALQQLDDDDWQSLMKQARLHRVTPLLHAGLLRMNYFSHLPPLVRAELSATAQAHAARNLAGMLQLKEIASLLLEQGIPVIVLKGGHLARTVYPSIGLRSVSDVDIMVPREKLEAAAKVLKGMGYHFAFRFDLARLIQEQPALPELQKADALPVDLHWHIELPRAPFRIDLEGLWTRAEPLIGLKPAFALSREDVLLHVCLHATYHHIGKAGLYALFDIANISCKPIDWNVVVERAQQWQAERCVFLSLQTARALAGAAIPPDILQTLQPADYTNEVLRLACEQFSAAQVDSMGVRLLPGLLQSLKSRPPGQSLLQYVAARLTAQHALAASGPGRIESGPLWFRVLWFRMRMLAIYAGQFLRLIFSRQSGHISDTLQEQSDRALRLSEWLKSVKDSS